MQATKSVASASRSASTHTSSPSGTATRRVRSRSTACSPACSRSSPPSCGRGRITIFTRSTRTTPASRRLPSSRPYSTRKRPARSKRLRLKLPPEPLRLARWCLLQASNDKHWLTELTPLVIEGSLLAPQSEGGPRGIRILQGLKNRSK